MNCRVSVEQHSYSNSRDDSKPRWPVRLPRVQGTIYTLARRAVVRFLFSFHILQARQESSRVRAAPGGGSSFLRHFFLEGLACFFHVLAEGVDCRRAAAGGYEDKSVGGCQARTRGVQITGDLQQYREKPKGGATAFTKDGRTSTCTPSLNRVVRSWLFRKAVDK